MKNTKWVLHIIYEENVYKKNISNPIGSWEKDRTRQDI